MSFDINDRVFCQTSISVEKNRQKNRYSKYIRIYINSVQYIIIACPFYCSVCLMPPKILFYLLADKAAAPTAFSRVVWISALSTVCPAPSWTPIILRWVMNCILFDTREFRLRGVWITTCCFVSEIDRPFGKCWRLRHSKRITQHNDRSRSYLLS